METRDRRAPQAAQATVPRGISECTWWTPMKVGSCCWLLGTGAVMVDASSSSGARPSPGLGPSPVRCRPSPAAAWVKGREAIAQATGRSFRTARSRLRARPRARVEGRGGSRIPARMRRRLLRGGAATNASNLCWGDRTRAPEPSSQTTITDACQLFTNCLTGLHGVVMIVGHPDGREGKVGRSRQAAASRWSLRKDPAACARLLAL